MKNCWLKMMKLTGKENEEEVECDVEDSLEDCDSKNMEEALAGGNGDVETENEVIEKGVR